MRPLPAALRPDRAIERARARVCRRLIGALCVSAALHAMFFQRPNVSEGRRASALRSVSEAAPLAVALIAVPPSLVVVPEEPADVPTPPPVPPAAPPRVARSSPALPGEPAKLEHALAEARDPTYYPTRQLDVLPALAAGLELSAQSGALADAAAGRVLLLVLIDVRGEVDDVSVVEAEPAGALEDEARRALFAARFTPARKDGRAVRSRLLIRLAYGERD